MELEDRLRQRLVSIDWCVVDPPLTSVTAEVVMDMDPAFSGLVFQPLGRYLAAVYSMVGIESFFKG